jgi:hypothetical protein
MACCIGTAVGCKPNNESGTPTVGMAAASIVQHGMGHGRIGVHLT